MTRAPALLAGCVLFASALGGCRSDDEVATAADARPARGPLRRPPMFGERPVALATAAPAATGPGTAQGAAPPPTAEPALDALSFPELIAAIRARAQSGQDPELSGHVDLLEAIERYGTQASTRVSMKRVPDLERSIGAAWRDGTAYASLVTYVEPGATAEQMQRVYLSYDRYAEWLGRAEVSLVGREGDDAIAAANGVREGPFGLKFGAKWRFRAHPIRRGRALVNVVTMIPSADTEHMRATRSLLVAFPEADGARVVEIAASDVDIDTPPLVGGIAMSIAAKDVRHRAESLRSRWQEVGR